MSKKKAKQLQRRKTKGPDPEGQGEGETAYHEVNAGNRISEKGYVESNPWEPRHEGLAKIYFLTALCATDLF